MASSVLLASESASSSTSRSAPNTSTTTPSASIPTPAPAPAPAEDPMIRLTTIDELFQQIDRVPGDILIVTHASPQDFAAIEHARGSRRRKVRFRRYYANSRVLVITIPTGLHEKLHLELNRKYEHKLVPMGLEDSWTPIGSTSLRAGHPGGDSGESDSAAGPRPARDGPGAWPTLVIEAGHSESLHRLRQDVRWWFDASNHQVKIVLLAKFDHGQREIRLEKWEEELPAVRPGAMSTRSVVAAVAPNTRAPVLRQTITITRNATSPPSYNVTSGVLVLSFRLLFLRDPGPGEEDVVFSIPDLQVYAERVWAQV